MAISEETDVTHALEAPERSPIKVSVIVPVYNPGEYLERCVRSILDQSLPAAAVEAIFVDDGSTDESPARLDALAEQHANIRIIHQENSGWPGKPRNVGMAAANGEYLYFLDNDDALGREALERMHDFATRNGSDIVIGKMAGHGRTVPRDLFLRSRERATLKDTALLDSLTPHKLFRRAFVEQHGLRFPEGRRRLEDHVFVVKAYFLADVISVYADYVCYYHYRREDASNAGLRPLEPAGYFGNLREVLAIVEEHTEPGAFRNRLLERFARAEMLGRLRGRGFLEQPEEYRASLFAEIRGVLADHVPPAVDENLAPTYRTQLALVRADRRDLLEAYDRTELPIRATARLVEWARTPNRTIRVAVDAGLEHDDGPFTVERSSDGLLLPVPAEVAAALPDGVRRLPEPLKGTARLVVRRREDSADLVVPSSSELRTVDRPDGTVGVELALTAELDPATVASGDPMWPGMWHLVVRVELFGHHRETRVAARGATARHRRDRPLRFPRITLIPRWVKDSGQLVLEVRRANRATDTRVTSTVLAALRRALGPARRALRAVLGRRAAGGTD